MAHLSYWNFFQNSGERERGRRRDRYLLHITHVGLELLLRVSQIGALAAGSLVVHLEHVGGEALRARRLVVAEQADEWLCVGVEMTLETPLVGARPGAIAAGEALLALGLQQARAGGAAAAGAGTGAGHRLLGAVHDGAHMQRQHRAIVQFLLLELGQRHVGGGCHRLDGLHNAHAGRGGMSLCLQERIVNVNARCIDRHIAASAGMMRTAAGSAAGATAGGHMASRLVDVVLQLAMHAQKVLLDVIGAIELLEAGIALKGLLVLMDVLVPCIQIPAIR